MNARVRILDGFTVAGGLTSILAPAFVGMPPTARWAHVLAGMTVAAFAGYALARTRRGLPRGPTPSAAAALGVVVLVSAGDYALAGIVLAISGTQLLAGDRPAVLSSPSRLRSSHRSRSPGCLPSPRSGQP